MNQPPEHSDEARERLQQTGEQGLGELFAEYRDRLRGMVALRIDARLKGRIDPSDIIQETFVEANDRLKDYLQNPDMPPFLWIRFLTMQRLQIMHRRHLQTKQRDARREISIHRPQGPQASSVHLAELLLDHQTGPVQKVHRAEQQMHLARSLEQMDETDREVLVLRHFEGLGNSEVAQILKMTEAAASQRYYRALKKLKTMLDELGESSLS